MKVLFLVDVFPTISETFIVNQINSVRRRDVDVSVYSYNDSGFSGHTSVNEFNLLEKTYYYQAYPESRKKRLKEVFGWLLKNFFGLNFKASLKVLKQKELYKKESFLILFYEAKWFLKKNRTRKFKVIHAHFGPNGERIAKLFDLGIFPNTKLITTFHGYDLTPEIARKFHIHYPNILKYSKTVTVNTEYMRSLIEKSEYKFDNIRVIPMGIDVSFFKKEMRNNPQNKVFKILFCGRLIPLKAPNLAIDILEELLKSGYSNCIMNIIGEGPMRPEIEKTLINRGLNDKVNLLGALNQDEVKAIMANSSVLIMPGIKDPETGRSETQGLVIQEAQAMELPVLVSDVGGMKYGVIHDTTGYVIKERDIKKFAQTIGILINNNQRLNELGKNGRKFVERNYNSSELAGEWINIYKN